MLTEKEQAYCVKLIQRYRFLAKLTLIPMSFPVAGLLYQCLRNDTAATVRLETLVWEIILFVVAWTGFMSFHIKADVLNDIANGPRLEGEAESE
jgi:hypothetical protein